MGYTSRFVSYFHDFAPVPIHHPHIAEAVDAAMFEALFEHSPDALFISTDDMQPIVIACNSRAVEMFDAPESSTLLEQLNRDIRQFVRTSAVLPEQTELLHQQGFVRSERHYTTLAERNFWGEHLVRLIPVKQGFMRLTRVIDITSQKELEEELRHTNAILADAESIAQLGTWEFDLATRAITWSDETFRLYGLEPRPGVVPAEMFWGLIHPDDVSKLREAVTKIQADGTIFKLEIRGLQPDGSYHFHETRAKVFRSDAGDITKIIGAVRNINADKRREAELLYNQEQLENIINNITEVIIQLNFTGIIQFASKNWETLTGQPVADTLHRSFVDFIHPDDAATLYQLMLDSLDAKKGQRFAIEYRLWHSSLQEWRWHNANASLIRTAEGAPLHILATLRDISTEKHVAEKLRRSESSLSEAQKMARLGSWYTDLATGTTEWSEVMYEIYDHPRTSRPLTGQEFLNTVHPDDKYLVAKKLDAAVKAREMGALEFRVVRPDGSFVWLDARVQPVVSPVTKRTTALLGVIWDVTERKLNEEQIRSLNLHLEERIQHRTHELQQANAGLRANIEERALTAEALQRSQNNLRTLIESTNDSIWSIDRDYRFTTINASYFSILRLSHGSTLDVGDSALVETLGIPAEKWREYYDRVLFAERFSLSSQYRLTGYTFDVDISFSPILSENNTVTGAVVFARDVTERLAAERETREREALLNLILETVATGVALTNPNGIIVRVNRAFAQMLDYAPEELVGRHYSLTIPKHRRTLGALAFQKLLAERTRFRAVEIQLLTKHDTLVEVELAQTVIANESDELFVVSSVNNITERKQAETEVRRALEQERELSALQSRFVVMVSHEFRTPLTTIRASAQLLARNEGKWSREKKQSYFEDIETSVEAMTELLEDVLSWGKAHAKRIPFEPKPTDILDFFETVLDGFRVVEEHRSRIITHVQEPDVAQIAIEHRIATVDTKLLRQILTNLLSNALKYSPSDTSVLVEMVVDVRSVSFRIKDNGIGIAEEDQKHLFEPFYRAANVGSVAGTGLGLAIVRQAVELHGGSIHLTSSYEAGTEFIVVIPCTFAQIM